ncbi:uncharacterized protein SPSC_03176 [Sporisorium scitamineum]|uniref:Ysc84 actin-binding domain-containing protein n=1 Tax=Sporisorium scitamineum TaxID=49012 RepID=A0A0F7SA84_9BASI|nr:uncharacterized protein SPSC_03176 [Sporisorium scitamineum]CDW98359.1 hypothetical protein [Sporisorium scitamineum]
MSEPPPSRPSTYAAAASSSSSTNTEESRWKRWGKTAFDKSIVVSDWASGYANSASAKMGGERFWPKSNDFPEEVLKCKRILHAFTVEGIEAKPTAASNTTADDADTIVEHDAKKNSFIHKKRKVLRKIPPSVIKRAKGIVIYTAMRSGIAPFGGAGGAGLMLARLPDGSWSAPSSISPNNLAVGLLLGFDIFDVILVVNTDRAMESFKSHKVTLGAETAVAAGPFGTGISGEMGIDRSPVFSYVRSRGLYGGVEAMAQAFLHRFDENERIYYWPGITARDIFQGKVRKPPLANPLYRALRDAESGVAQGDSLERTVYETVHAPPNVAVKQLQQEESAELLQDGERLKLPPTPEELEAMEEAGIPDEFDLELERKEKEEAARRAEEEKREIMALPPPPKHKNVVGYWQSRGTTPGGKRRVAPSPLHIQSAADEEKTVDAEEEEGKMDLIDLDEPSKPPLPPRRAQGFDENTLADELEGTTLDSPHEPAKEPESHCAEERAATGIDGEPVTLIAAKPDTEVNSRPSTPKSAVPIELTQSTDSLSRSTSLTRPSRPPRRAAAAAGAPRTPTTTPTHLFFDWDETITASDTLSLIAPPEHTQSHGPPFSSYTSSYLSDLSKFESSFGERSTWTSQLEFLSEIDAVEQASVARVEEGGLFKGMSLTGMLERAETVGFRTGWEGFYTWLDEHPGVEVDIISVGWSSVFIRHAIEHHRQTGVINTVYANDVEMDEGVGTGKLSKSSEGAIRTGMDKLRVMRAHKGPGPNVYVGDSTTDLPCLIEADYGLIMKPRHEFETSSISTIIDQTKPPIKKLYGDAKEFLDTYTRNEVEAEKDGEKKGLLIRVDDWTQALVVIQRIQQLRQQDT